MKVNEIKILPPRRLKPFKAILSDATSKADKYTTEAVKGHQDPPKRRVNEYLKRQQRKSRKSTWDPHGGARDPRRKYADMSTYDHLADHEKKVCLVKLLDQICDNNNNYSDDDIFLQMDRIHDINIDDAVMLFYAMCDLELIIQAAPGRWYKTDTVPF